MGLLQGTLDQLLSNLCLSILAMLTFLSKFYKWKEWQTFDWWMIQVIQFLSRCHDWNLTKPS